MGWLVNATPRRFTRYALYRRPGGPQGRSGGVRTISIPGPSSHYTDALSRLANGTHEYSDCWFLFISPPSEQHAMHYCHTRNVTMTRHHKTCANRRVSICRPILTSQLLYAPCLSSTLQQHWRSKWMNLRARQTDKSFLFNQRGVGCFDQSDWSCFYDFYWKVWFGSEPLYCTKK